MKKINHLNCSEIENLIIQKYINDLDTEQLTFVEKHLKNCVRCQEFQATLISLNRAMKIEINEFLKPAPKVYQTILNRMSQIYDKKTNFLDDIVEKIYSILDYRIPLYQGMIGMVLIGLLVWGTLSLPFGNPQTQLNISVQPRSEQSQFRQLNILNSYDVLKNQKIGKSVSEDTMLIKFLSPAL